jgi:predicted nucleic acid-binding protein
VSGSAKPTRTYLLDTNVFVAAIKNPRKETETLRFLLDLIGRDDVELVGNEYWVEEMVRYAEEFHSQTAAWLASLLMSRTRLVHVEDNYVRVCLRYMGTPDPADVLHAATCLQERAILISNDKHFNRVRDQGVIEVWKISQAIRSI